MALALTVLAPTGPAHADDGRFPLPAPPAEDLVVQTSACDGCDSVSYRAPADAQDDRAVLTRGPAGALPSPDGGRQAYVARRAGAWQVGLAGPDGEDPALVATLPGEDPVTVADWSADGSTLLLVQAPDPRAVVDGAYLLAAGAGGDPQPLVPTDRAAALGLRPGMVFAPGTADRVVATGSLQQTPVSDAAYLLQPGQAPVTLVPGTARFSDATSKAGPSWSPGVAVSPDARRIAFDGGPVQSLVTGEVLRWSGAASPVFSRDSRWLYGVDRGQVRRYDLEGSTESQVLAPVGSSWPRLVRAVPGQPVDTVRPVRLALQLRGREVALSWYATPGAAAFTLQRYDGERAAGPATRVPLAAGAASVVDSVVPGRTYTWLVTALDDSGAPRGAAVRTATATDPLSPIVPTVVSDVSATGRYVLRFRPTSGPPAAVGQLLPDGVAPPSCAGGWGLPGYGPLPAGVGPGQRDTSPVVACDAYSNRTSPVPVVATGPLDDDTGVRTGRWRRSSPADRWASTLSTSASRGAALTFLVRGTAAGARGERRLWLVGDTGPRQGSLQVLVDGRRTATVSTRAARAAVRQHLWTGVVDARSHRVRVVVVGDGLVAVDALGASA
ncbi:TolB-like translocation protein [Motilibacter rhizosphaerae]|uniref:hypothetical protein n=1 Tax=Motilibacter rhizosphaerae TaxID=598652 RepID=UPI00102B1546|nr:hypothetical protein [Motilibacter rhizosphaerae]